MDDGLDEKLKELGYDAYSVKKMRAWMVINSELTIL